MEPGDARALLASIGGRVKALRILRGMTLRQLGSAVGVAHTVVYQWQRSGDCMRVGTVSRLAKALNADPAWLAFGDKSTPDP